MSAREWLPGSAWARSWVALATLLALIGAGFSTLFAATLQVKAQEAEAEVRIVHGITAAGPLDVYVDGAIALIGIVYGEASGVLRLPAGERELAVVPTGATPDEALAAGSITLREGASIYAALLGTVDAASVGLFGIDERPLEQGRARFRIISGASDAAPFVPLFVGGDALSAPLGFGDASEYATLDAGTYDLDFLDAESGASILTMAATVFAEGTTTDVIVVGQVADGTLAALIEAVPVQLERATGQLAQIVPGTCQDAGAPLADLGLVQPGQGESVGETSGPAVLQGYGLAALPFATLIAAPHAVVVADSEGAGDFTVCGEIGGQLTDTGALVIALQPVAEGGSSGFAVLAPALEAPDSTGVSVFLTGSARSSLPATPTAANG